MAWAYTQTTTEGGYFVVLFRAPGQSWTDVTYFRNVPVQIQSYSSGDPFSDAVAVLSFPQITGFDSFGVGELSWFNQESDVNIYYIEPDIDSGDSEPNAVINSITQQKTIDYISPSGSSIKPVFQGFVAACSISQSSSQTSAQVELQGALYQIDRIVSKPSFPTRPYLYEELISKAMSPTITPSLRTKGLGWPMFPDGWDIVIPSGNPTVFTPIGKPGSKITGYWDRTTGNFSKSLTGFVQERLQVMFTKEDCGVRPGDKWTVLMGNGRKPYLKIRTKETYTYNDISVPAGVDLGQGGPQIEATFGQIGVDCNLSSDFSQIVNVIYGEGIGSDGVKWAGTQINDAGDVTTYKPLGFKRSVMLDQELGLGPNDKNSFYEKYKMRNEAYIKYGKGLGFDQAEEAAQLQLSQFSEPAWSGNITLSVDPWSLWDESYISRWKLKAGNSIRLKYFAGTGAEGMILHIAEVNASPMSGTVSLTVDSQFRDLLTLDQVMQRTRDPLTPAKLLALGQASVFIEDIYAPWNANNGSGVIPVKATNFYKDKGFNEAFPFATQAKKYPPRNYPQYYVRVNANASKSRDRWSFFPIVLSEKGSARLTQFAAFDRDGNRVNVAFHVSIYNVIDKETKTLQSYGLNPNNMPHQGQNYSPFRTGAFTKTDDNGVPWSIGPTNPAIYYDADKSMVIGWGNKRQKAGYWPGRSSDAGTSPTGILIDEASWSWNFDDTLDLGGQRYGGRTKLPKIPRQAYSYSAAIYCEHPEDVYFIGRIYRENPGQS